MNSPTFTLLCTTNFDMRPRPVNISNESSWENLQVAFMLLSHSFYSKKASVSIHWNLYSTEEKRLYWFRMTGSVNDRIFMFGRTNPLKQSPSAPKRRASTLPKNLLGHNLLWSSAFISLCQSCKGNGQIVKCATLFSWGPLHLAHHWGDISVVLHIGQEIFMHSWKQCFCWELMCL